MRMRNQKPEDKTEHQQDLFENSERYSHSAEEVVKAMAFLSKWKEGIHQSVSVYCSVITDKIYAKITIEDTYTSDNLADFIDHFYIPVTTSEIHRLNPIEQARDLILELIEISNNKSNIHKNEHGASWCDKVFHPHI